MIKFVGAEQLIAIMLIEKRKQGIREISLQDLGEYGIYIQQKSITENIDAVFLTSKLKYYNAIYDFSDYFKCETDHMGHTTKITIQKTKDIDDLESRFIGYLPDIILDFLKSAVNDYKAA